MDELTEVSDVLHKLAKATCELDLQKQILEFNKRCVIQKFWSSQVNELLDIVQQLEQVVHEKNLMLDVQFALLSCMREHEKLHTPHEQYIKSIREKIDEFNKNNPK